VPESVRKGAQWADDYLRDLSKGVASRPLRLVDAPAAGYSDGFAYMPLAFVAELVVEGL
jgi:hypothetical protein